METVAPLQDIIEIVKDNGGDTFKYCYQCGMCDTVCPWNRVRQFSMRKIVRQAVFGLTEIDNEEIWRCTTCGRCPEVCPRDVRQVDSGVALRRIATEYGVFPENVKSIRVASGNMGAEGNPLGEDREKRADWAKDLPVQPFTEDAEILYFSCCYLSYDKRLRKVAAATAKILDQAGVAFGTLGIEENCCGESIRKAGDEGMYKRMAKANIKAFIDKGVKRVLVSSPHCYHTFKNEYPEFMVHFEAVHTSEYVFELIRDGRITPTKELAQTVTYHDPCYLGRHNGVYDAPREILRRIPGLELRELPDARQESLCCGGGGGRIWADTPKGERFSDLRVEQARVVGAGVLATACPYCIANFEDSRLAMENPDALDVVDIMELLQLAL